MALRAVTGLAGRGAPEYGDRAWSLLPDIKQSGRGGAERNVNINGKSRKEPRTGLYLMNQNMWFCFLLFNSKKYTETDIDIYTQAKDRQVDG